MSYDRFGYVWQNPFMNNDPSGEELVSTIIAILKIVGYVLAAHTAIRTINGYANGYYTGFRPLASVILQVDLSVINVGKAIGSTLFSSAKLTAEQLIATAAITAFSTTVLTSLVGGANIGDALSAAAGTAINGGSWNDIGKSAFVGSVSAYVGGKFAKGAG